MKKNEKTCCSSDAHKNEVSCCSGREINPEESCTHNHIEKVELPCSQESIEKAENCCCESAQTKASKKSSSHKSASSSCESQTSCCGIAISNSAKNETSCCGIAISNSAKNETSCCGVASNRKSVNPWILLGVSLLSLIASFLLSHFKVYDKAPKGISILDFAWVAIIISGYPIYKGAFISLRKYKKITSALLISTAMSASILMGILNAFEVGNSLAHGSYFFAAGEIAFLMALGQNIEAITVGKARSAITELIKISPTTAFKKVNGKVVEVSVSALSVGDIVLVKPNELVPIDGIVLEGNSSIDQSTITGEYTPVDISKDSIVYAGTKNLYGAFEIEVSKKSNETVFSKLVEYIKSAEQNKAPIVKLADKSASVLVLSAIAVSLFVFLISLFAIKVDVWSAIQRGATILVVVCPCAFALATPIAISAAIGNSSRKGILVKNGQALEVLGKVKTIAFDKTGTLTKGQLVVDEIIPFNFDKNELLKLVASAEVNSEHPIAKAILDKHQESLYEVSNFESIVGSGFKAVINNKTIMVSKLCEQKDNIPKEIYDEISKSGKTVVATSYDNTFIGLITLSDVIKEHAKESLEDLHKMGISTIMLTGDNTNVAQNVANELMPTSYKADLLPEDKVAAIEEIASREKIAMVGDGINDGPALVASDCSIAMGGIGNSVVMQTADITLMRDDISKVPFLVKLSRRTISTIKVNIALSLSISALAVVLSIFGLINVVTGALLHNVSSVLVCLNSALLLGYKGKKKKEK